ncbi:MAG: hypothetical protein CMG70_05495 [Candidatus Marinimicrobia bacterium]|nr:hypothetical protein [Candidatus Neomarinimicrobiota bacterium]MDP6877561.1 hypothetical protein [Candidatus Neomarinimicrobiota bacterium]|tara:strand:- start:373 stop:891 length:519 start_codon:yes stop_codon:yes gene_type:complete
MSQVYRIISMIMILFLISCEDQTDKNKAMIMNEITTDNVADGAYYFNLDSGEKDNTSWHLIFQNIDVPFGGQQYKMPSFGLSASSMLAIDSSSDFESIETSPSPNAFAPEGGRMIYGGSHAALTYDMAAHKVGVSNDTYIIYDTVTHKVFKVHFDEYSGGIVIFRYAELTSS